MIRWNFSRGEGQIYVAIDHRFHAAFFFVMKTQLNVSTFFLNHGSQSESTSGHPSAVKEAILATVRVSWSTPSSGESVVLGRRDLMRRTSGPVFISGEWDTLRCAKEGHIMLTGAPSKRSGGGPLVKVGSGVARASMT